MKAYFKAHQKVVAVLLLCGLALCACGTPQSGEPSGTSAGGESVGAPSEGADGAVETSAEPSEENSSGESSAPAADAEEIARYAQYFVPRTEGNGLIDYDPDRTIYFSCQNWDYDYYVRSTGSQEKMFYILSTEPLDVEGATMTIPIQSSYRSQIVDWSAGDLQKTELTSTEGKGMPFDLFLCYKGIDWKRYRELEDGTDVAYDQYKAGEITEEEYHAALDAYWNLNDAYWEEFESLPPEALPKFYVYFASFRLTKETLVDESFRYIDFQIEGKLYHQEIGEVRIHTEKLPNGEDIGFRSMGLGITKDCPCPYVDEAGAGTISMEMEESMTIKKVYEYTGKELTYANVRIYQSWEDYKAREKPYLDFDWDMETPFRAEKGNYVEIDVVFRDERLKQLEYSGYVYLYLEYSFDGEDYSSLAWYTNVHRESDTIWGSNWTRYALVFSGLDMRARWGIYE